MKESLYALFIKIITIVCNRIARRYFKGQAPAPLLFNKTFWQNVVLDKNLISHFNLNTLNFIIHHPFIIPFNSLINPSLQILNKPKIAYVILNLIQTTVHGRPILCFYLSQERKKDKISN